ncbi:DMP19 family protein [Aeromonas piscicola]|uniref:DMP19 family protein n=1 Tax=Aeromonas piscicola TaxID=600645 RepID=A0ABT7QEB5_9GAMM|nr:DMP19 family protein [Aeromonas piscicola]MDM5131959.1 DMP19 family protein [Aeromonas piscicola]
MHFSEFSDNEEPAFDVFNACHEIVFAGSDGNTEYLERISPEARLVYLLWCFDGEVHNGGFDQLFFNSLGDHCLEILAGLKKVNAIKSYGLLEKATRWFPESKPSLDREKRCKQLARYKDDENYEADLENLDTEFYKYEENLAELLHTFVRANKAASLNA